MPTIGAIALVAAVAVVLLMSVEWQRVGEDTAAIDRTVKGFHALLEGAYAYRTQIPTQWPSDMNTLCSTVPSINQPTCGGINGEGRTYSLVINGSDLVLSTRVSDPSHSAAVAREFGASVAVTGPVGGLYTIELDVPDPGSISLMRQTLLTDGTNEMQEALWMSNTFTAGDTCSGGGLAVDSNGALLRCSGGTWTTH